MLTAHFEIQSASREYVLLALPCAAMGMQTVTVTRINGLRVYTTYLTGSLSKFAEAVVDYAFWWKDSMIADADRRFWPTLRESLAQKSIQHAALTA